MRTTKRFFAVLVAVVMIMCAVPVMPVTLAAAPEFDYSSMGAADGTGSADDFSNGGTQGGIIKFGAYPQTKVTDSATISALNSRASGWQSYGYYSGTGTFADGQMTAKDYMQYCDVKFGGNKYRGVTFSQYRPDWTSYTSSVGNTYQDDNGYTTGTTYWFKYEPLQWKVLDPSEGLVMCVSLIDSQPYNNYVLYSGTDSYGNSACWGDTGKTYYASDYANSSLRKWLNETFYATAFTEDQQNRIAVNCNQNNDGYYTLTGDTNFMDYDSDPTNDKIFLLSYDEALNSSYGFATSSGTNDTALQAKGTDYAKCQGLYVYSVDSPDGSSWWWLRSPGLYSYYSCYVNYGGNARNGNSSVSRTYYGVRPVCVLKSLQDDTSSEYEIAGQTFDKPIDYYAKFGYSSTYDPTLANLLCALSAAAYDLDATLAAQASLRFCDGEYGYYNHYYDYSYDPNKCAYSIGYKASCYSDDIICLISVKGTNPYNPSDWITDFNFATNEEEKHTGFANPANDIFAELQHLNEVLEINGTVKYFITGHSLGAAVGNLLAVKLMENGVSSANIFDYNFACPDVACKSSFPYYGNIFNLCNYEDTVPFVPGNLCSTFVSDGSRWGKYGQTIWFNKSSGTLFPFSDHSIDLYLEFFNQRLTPSNGLFDGVLGHTGWTGWLARYHCPVDVIVTDTNGTRIASVIGGEIDYYDSLFGDVIIMTDGDKKAIFVKDGLDFNVDLIGTDTGEMTYSVEKYDLATGETQSVKTFSNVALENGKLMYSPVSNAETTEDVELFVVLKDGDQIQPIYTVDSEGAETEIAHIWDEGPVTKPATCKEEGVRTFTCTLCGDTYTEPVGKTAHTLTVINQRDATYDAEGYTGDQYCTTCQQTITAGTAIPKLEKPTDPQPQQPSGGCKWCGKTHGGAFGWLVKLFHNLFAAFFGARY